MEELWVGVCISFPHLRPYSIWALSLRLQCSGPHTLDTPVSQRQLYIDLPTLAPSPKGLEIMEIPTLLCRRLQRVLQEGSNVYQLNQWLWELGWASLVLGACR